MKTGTFTVAAGLVALLAGYLAFWPVPIQPYGWTPEPSPGFSGAFVRNDILASAKPLADTLVTQHWQAAGSPRYFGPEDLAQGPDGQLYAGLADGSVLRLDPDTGAGTVFAQTGGRPLGMAFDTNGRLIVADARRGLLAIDPDGKVNLLTDSLEPDDHSLRYLDSVIVARDGRIWFTAPSTRWSLDQIDDDIFESRPTGRLLRYDPATGKTEKLLDGLMYANGLVFGPDENFLLVDELSAYRVTRLWLKGEKAGQRDVFADNLPGYPDNISVDADGRYWVGLSLERNALLDKARPHPFLVKMLYRLPQFLSPKPVFPGIALGLDDQGRVVANLQDATNTESQVTGARAFGERLYIGSLVVNGLRTLPLPHP